MTSAIETIEICCPHCHHLYEDWYRPSVNLDLDDFDEEYVDSCASAVCPQCGFKVYVDNTLIVKDGIFHLSDSTNEGEK